MTYDFKRLKSHFVGVGVPNFYAELVTVYIGNAPVSLLKRIG